MLYGNQLIDAKYGDESSLTGAHLIFCQDLQLTPYGFRSYVPRENPVQTLNSVNGGGNPQNGS